MADADDPKPTAGDATTRWLDETLWREAPSTKHLRKFRPRVRASVPTDLMDALVTVDAVRLSGLPEAAEVVGAERLESGDWSLPPENAGDFAIVAPRDGDGGAFNLSIELVGKETASGDVISLLGGIEIELPSTHRGPLFRDLPDMRKAREREAREAAEQAARDEAQRKEREEAEAAARKAEAEKAAAEKAAAEQAAVAAEQAPKPPKPAPKAAEKPPAKRPVARMKPAAPAAPKAEKPAAAAKPPKPATPRTAVMKPAQKTTNPAAKSPATSVTSAPSITPPARPTRRRTAVMQPAAPAPKAEEPAPPKTSGAKWSTPPKRTAPPAPPKAAPEAAPKTAQPKTSGVKWSKPPARKPDPVPVVAVDETTAATTNAIAIELGGAPEVSDPHFRIFVDGAQVLDGNIDWSLGMPAADGDDDGLCWQTREISWDFSDGFPDEIAISYDNGGPEESAAGTLLVRAIDVGGLGIDVEGPFAQYPNGRADWAGQGQWNSWVGVMQIDVAGALRQRDGGKDGGETGSDIESEVDPEPEPEPEAAAVDVTPEAARDALPDIGEPAAETLVLHPDASDLANPAVMASFGRLRAFIQGHGADDDGNLKPMLDHLGFDDARWSDLLVLDPNGLPVAIDGAPPPPMPEVGSRFSADDVEAAMERLRDLPGTDSADDFEDFIFDSVPEEIVSFAEPISAPLTQAGEELRDVFLAERLVRAEAEKRARQTVAPAPAQAAVPAADRETPIDWKPLPATEGLRVRNSFLTAWEIRADSRMQDMAETAAAALPDDTVSAPIEVTGDRGAGEAVGQAFLMQHLKSALEILHAPRDKAQADAPITAEGDAISGSFLDEMLGRAKARMSPEGGPATA